MVVELRRRIHMARMSVKTACGRYFITMSGHLSARDLR
jgi:hypothetical protein